MITKSAKTKCTKPNERREADRLKGYFDVYSSFVESEQRTTVTSLLIKQIHKKTK